MTIEAVKSQLHEYIEHAEEQLEIVSDKIAYDEVTLNMLETRFNNMVSVKDKTVTLDQTIDNIRQSRVLLH